MSDRTPTLAEVIRSAMDSRLIDVHTSMPGKVQRVDRVTVDGETTTYVDVEPQLRRAIRTEAGELVTEALPVLPSVPVAWPRAGGYFITFPIAVGDFVLVTFCERDIGAWMEAAQATNPGDLRMHGLAGAVAYPGLYPAGEGLESSHASNMVLGKDGGPTIHVKATEIHLGQEHATAFVALATLVSTQLTALKTAINGAAVVGGDGGAAFKANIIAALASWPGSVAATKVKAT